ncbi:hypothetical protein B0A50_01340 [Salinomyces thailandicus]|uniref:Uncharacterized protein n=1 Tax=Salinomyces thailandicus TaxID=706561 RepID=A0A4U0U9S0_9PEZI|nr:hypothetical protein B0A50_01340 [Salinomyces thailandica]
MHFVRDICSKWGAADEEWIANNLRPPGPPRDWSTPLLEQLWKLSILTKDDVGKARSSLTAAVTRRTKVLQDMGRVTVADVESAIVDLASQPQHAEDSDARSPALLVTLPVPQPSQPTTPVLSAAQYIQPATDAIDSRTPGPPSAVCQPTANPLEFDDQAIDRELRPQTDMPLQTSAPVEEDPLQLTLDRIDEMHKLAAVEEKAKARRLVLEREQRQWVAAQSGWATRS